MLNLQKWASGALLVLALVHPAWARAEDEHAQPTFLDVQVTTEQLGVLSQVEAAMVEARELGARLMEPSALRVLGAAEERMLDALELPFAHAFLAEIYLQMGLSAAQLGAMGLAETELRRAFSLDPSRHVEAAEAPPGTLALAQRLALAQQAAAVSETPLNSRPAAAQVFLDGTRQALGERWLRAPAGLHVLVLRAPGYAPYARVVQLEAGRRASMEVQLSPLPALEVSELGTGKSGDRRLTGAASARAAACPSDDKACREAKPRWKRWPVWVASSAAVLLGAAAAIWVRRDPHQRPERALQIDPGMLPP